MPELLEMEFFRTVDKPKIAKWEGGNLVTGATVGVIIAIFNITMYRPDCRNISTLAPIKRNRVLNISTLALINSIRVVRDSESELSADCDDSKNDSQLSRFVIIKTGVIGIKAI
jgi:hypothetical protein